MPRGKTGRPWWKRFLLFAVPRLLAIAAVVGLLYWQWQPITSWIGNTVTAILQLFGWGLLLSFLVVAVIIALLFLRRKLLLSYWNKWLGGIILIVAVWAVLAFFPGEGVLRRTSLGGYIGLSLLGDTVLWGALRILGMVVVGVFLVVPRACCGLVARFFVGLAERFKKTPSEVPLPSPGAGPARSVAVPEKVPKYSEVKPKQERAATSPWVWGKLKKPPVVTGGTPAPRREEPGVETAKETPEAIAVEAQSPQDVKQATAEVWKKYGESGAVVTADGWRLPSLDILDQPPEVEFSQADNTKKARLIEEALSSYGVEGKVVQINVGPTVTQFGIEPGWDRKIKEIREKDKNGEIRVRTEEVSRTRVKVERINSLANDLALALAAPSIRIEAPVPGKSIVGIEVPNVSISLVNLRGVVESSAFQKMEARSKMAVALGKGAGGEAVVGDLTKMPHLLIAGATGSGKTVCINSIICGFLLYNTPADLRFIMIDPKRVELTPYNSVPHLATPVIVETDKALSALRWLSQEMDKRYQTLAAARARNIETYNKGRTADRFPYLVLVIDELADLMMTSGEEVEHTLCRLAQLARATGIHLLVATQRPSVDVITGLIKANFPTRISFAVTSQVDSRTILDTGGAEKLLGRGDMLYMPTEASKPKRLQGCYVSDAETERIVYFWGSQRKDEASQLRLDDIVAAGAAQKLGIPADPLLEEARKLSKEYKHISTSFLQRHLRIGYPRAARIMEQLEEASSGEGKEEKPAEE